MTKQILSINRDEKLIKQKLYYIQANYEQVGKKKKMYDCPFAFDIETSSFYQNDNKVAIMYIWQFALPDETVIIGRTWHDFINLNNLLQTCLNLSPELYIYVSVCNLSYEFQFMRKWFNWLKVFATHPYKVCYCENEYYLHFHCAYFLSGVGLAKIGNDLKNPLPKSKDLDYRKIRNSKTPLSYSELKYCIIDVKILIRYIWEKIALDGNIKNIPLTKTSYVRRYVRSECLFGGLDPNDKAAGKFFKNYKSIISKLTLEMEEVKLLMRAFMGGYTHTSPRYANRLIGNKKNPVTSIDFTSSYPYCLIAFTYPMSKGELIEIKNLQELFYNFKNYCCVFDIEISNLKSKTNVDYYIPRSKCWKCIDAEIVNGRIKSAKKIVMSITDVDFEIINACYKMGSIKVNNFYRYMRGYLPTPLIECILKLYSDKTTLKDVEGREDDYLLAKSLLNSVYGCMATNILQDSIEYDDINGWNNLESDFEDVLEKYNNKYDRTLFYPWGVFCTAYARRNLWLGCRKQYNYAGGIIGIGNDYIYSDTDSIKMLNYDAHQKEIEIYNKMCTNLIKRAMSWHNLPIELAIPETIEGVKKPLGVWDFDGSYYGFKAIRAKCYMFNKVGRGVNITVAGLNKKVAVKWMLDKFRNNVFEAFDNEMVVPAAATGKQTHTYINDSIAGSVTDYLGNEADFHEKSFIHLEGCEYHLDLKVEYLNMIMGIQESEVLFEG